MRRLWWCWLIVGEHEVCWPALLVGLILVLLCAARGEAGIGALLAVAWACLWWPERWRASDEIWRWRR